jgi:hypothetical protein
VTPARVRATRLVLLLLIAGSAAAGAARPAPAPASDPLGERIYLGGVLADGSVLRGTRESGPAVAGADAACVNCHRRSGLGWSEGRSSVPPITGQFLFHARASSREELDLPFLASARSNRDAYTEETLARAIRQGIGVDGKPLSYLMPRYQLDDASMAALVGYLRGLTRIRVPGVEGGVLHFATIITPDADPLKRQAVLAVLQNYFADKNAAARSVAPPLHSYTRMMYRVVRQWQLHVWELTGPESGWESQLARHFAAEPVFAVISGLGGRSWEPVHRFCEHAALPCLFPNVEVPVIAEDDFHSLYFSKGVLLEAQLLAMRLKDPAAGLAAHRVVQVYRDDDVGAAAARALRAALGPSGPAVLDRRLKGERSAAALVRQLGELDAGDVLVLWLRAADVAALPAAKPAVAAVLLSGQMAGQEHAPLPSSWRSATRMAYPFDLPDQRVARVDFPIGWFRMRHIPVTDLQVQVDTYVACGLLAETLKHMVDAFVPDFLVERTEMLLEHRILTGYYPRLSLAPGQRFASKGGYLVRFADAAGPRLVADSDWLVPP